MYDPKEPIPIFYVDQTNFYEVAEILISKMQKTLPQDMVIFLDELAKDPGNIAEALKTAITRPAMMDLMQTEYGQGVLFGIILSHLNNGLMGDSDTESESIEYGEEF